MRTSVVIPARLASTRFPRKVLADLGGKPVIQHVWEQASKMTQATEIIIATDSDEVLQCAQAFGAKVVMTSPDCPNGTARIASILNQLQGDFILNVQGDEPFVEPSMLDKLSRRASETGCDMVTAVFALTSAAQIQNPNLVKAVLASDGRALYFSRSAVPHFRDKPLEQWHEHHTYWGHMGVYGYTRNLLNAYPKLTTSVLENVEKLEQLRFIDHGYTLQTIETTQTTHGIDTPEDLDVAIHFLKHHDRSQ